MTAAVERLDHCFACGAQVERVGHFYYLPDQAGFVPDDWKWWCANPATLVRCPECLSQGPRFRPSEAVLSSWYRQQSYSAAEVLSEGHEVALARLSQMSPETLVDVGCGAGTFLGKLPASMSVFGLEPSLPGVEQGRKWGRKIVVPDESGWSSLLPAKSDVISLFDVIEHIPSPKPFLERLGRHLAPDGRLVLFTGNAGSPWARRWGLGWWYHGWAGHLSCFSLAGLRKMLAELSFEVESVDTCVYMRQPTSLRGELAILPGRILARTGMLAAMHSLTPPVATGPFGVDHMLIIARRART